jgi:hypothetical protein
MQGRPVGVAYGRAAPAVIRRPRMPDDSTLTHYHESQLDPHARRLLDHVEYRLGILLDQFQQRLNAMVDQASTDLAAAMAALTTAVTGAVTEIQSLAAAIAAANANNDSAAIETAVGQINTLSANLTAAVTAATPPAPATPAAPAAPAAP